MFTIFGKILLIQLFLSVVVIYFLKRALELMLIDLGIKRLEEWRMPKGAEISEVKIFTYRNLNSSNKQRVLRAALKNMGSQAKVSFQIDKKLWGGMNIQFENEFFGYSLRSRLKESGMMK